DAGDYRDYATYFVAALAGETRVGKSLSTQPDLNGDGKVSLIEAHSYAYTEGFSKDIPFSTSDYYLELWEPWFTRWRSLPFAANNPYWVNAQRIAYRWRRLPQHDPKSMQRHASEQQQRLLKSVEMEQ